VGVVNARPEFDSPGQSMGRLMQQVQADYAEMPGLSVTLRQAPRLWTVDQPTCEEVFRRLLSSGTLRKTSKGRFVRAYPST
jgi:hypothetical protein